MSLLHKGNVVNLLAYDLAAKVYCHSGSLFGSSVRVLNAWYHSGAIDKKLTRRRSYLCKDRVSATTTAIASRGNLRPPVQGDLLPIYKRAMSLEVDFFSGQPHSGTDRVLPSCIVVDFDETCSAADTTSRILQTAINAAHQRAEEKGEDSQQVRRRLDGMLDWLVDNYSTSYSEMMVELLPEESAPPADGKYDEDWLSCFIERTSTFDRCMNDHITESEILAGPTKEQMQAAGRGVELRPSCIDTLRTAASLGVSCHVLSVSWSGSFIRGALEGAAAATATDKGKEQDWVSKIEINANELEFGDDGVATGGMDRQIECGTDKGRIFDNILIDVAGSGASGPSVFIGDSTTDLLALMAADVGIVMADSNTLKRVMKVAGIQVKPLVGASLATHSAPPDAPLLYYSNSWAEVAQFLFGGVAPQGGASTGKSEGGTKAAAVSSQAATAGSVEPSRVPKALTVAGSDSGGGAGIQADLKTFLALGVFGMSAVTALTAQNSLGVQHVMPVPGDVISRQITSIMSDLGADVIKTGMLPTVESVSCVAEAVLQYGQPPLVVDPVMSATSGDSLAGPVVLAAMCRTLLPLATIITPNIPEAEELLSYTTAGTLSIQTVDDMKEAARRLHSLGPQYVLVKGGHLSLQGDAQQATDVLFDGQSLVTMTSEYISTRNTHGTGCTLAAATAAHIARGASVPQAVERAREYLQGVLAASRGLTLGRGPQGPMNHGYRINDWSNLRERMDLRAYVVTDDGCNKRYARSAAEAVRLAVEGGASIVQLRMKDADGGVQVHEAREIMKIGEECGVLLVINDRVDVALAVNAHGVHVGQTDIPASAVRQMIGPSKILGVSVKSVDQALKGQADGADYLGVGAVFPTTTKDSRVMGVDGLAEICNAVEIPVVAIGGITAETAGQCIQAGAAGVAVVTAVFGVPDPGAASKQLLAAVNDALSQREV